MSGSIEMIEPVECSVCNKPIKVSRLGVNGIAVWHGYLSCGYSDEELAGIAAAPELAIVEIVQWLRANCWRAGDNKPLQEKIAPRHLQSP